jgi:Tfp pilus assembly protein PilP
MRLPSTLVILLFAATASAAPSVPARTGKAKAPEAAAQPEPSAPADAAEPPSTTPYNYNTDGRRDPFQSLTSTGTGAKSAPRPTTAGIAGIRVDELSVRGIMQSRERLVAMVQGPDNRTYLIHQGDKLADGVVKSITPQGLVLVQDVSDPRAKDKTREVRKPLRTPEDEKE